MRAYGWKLKVQNESVSQWCTNVANQMIQWAHTSPPQSLMLRLMMHGIGSMSGFCISIKNSSVTTWMPCWRASFICVPIFCTSSAVEMTAATRSCVWLLTFPPNFLISLTISVFVCLNVPINTNSMLNRIGFLYGLREGEKRQFLSEHSEYVSIHSSSKSTYA